MPLIRSSKPYRGRHSAEDGWSYSSSYQDKPSYAGRTSGGNAGEVGRKNPSGPRKRANSASDKVVTVSANFANKNLEKKLVQKGGRSRNSSENARMQAEQ